MAIKSHSPVSISLSRLAYSAECLQLLTEVPISIYIATRYENRPWPHFFPTAGSEWNLLQELTELAMESKRELCLVVYLRLPMNYCRVQKMYGGSNRGKWYLRGNQSECNEYAGCACERKPFPPWVLTTCKENIVAHKHRIEQCSEGRVTIL